VWSIESLLSRTVGNGVFLFASFIRMNDVTSLIVFGATYLLPLFLFVAICGAIFRKAGYSGWLGLLMIVPLVNLIWLVIFALSEWPIQRELARRRGVDGDASFDDVEILISEASRLERSGNWQEAANAFERVASMPGHPNAEYAANCATRLQARLDRAGS